MLQRQSSAQALSDEDVRALFEELDKNHDGAVQFDEFVAYWAQSDRGGGGSFSSKGEAAEAGTATSATLRPPSILGGAQASSSKPFDNFVAQSWPFHGLPHNSKRIHHYLPKYLYPHLH